MYQILKELNFSLNLSRSTKKKGGHKKRGAVDSDSDEKDSDDELSLDASAKKKPLALKVFFGFDFQMKYFFVDPINDLIL